MARGAGPVCQVRPGCKHCSGRCPGPTLRDKLATGDLDAAQLLAPLPLATSLGRGRHAGGRRYGSGAVSLNGNAITVSPALAVALLEAAAARPVASRRRSTAAALGAWLRERGRAIFPADALLLSALFFLPYVSMLRLWLQRRRVSTRTGMCASSCCHRSRWWTAWPGVLSTGSAWASPGAAWRCSTGRGCGAGERRAGLEQRPGEGAGRDRVGGTSAHPAAHLRLRLALMEACGWLAAPREPGGGGRECWPGPEYLDTPCRLPAAVAHRAFCLCPGADAAGGFAALSTSSGAFRRAFPGVPTGEWLLQQTGDLLGKPVPAERAKALVQQTYRTDLYREAARLLELASPSRDYKPG